MAAMTVTVAQSHSGWLQYFVTRTSSDSESVADGNVTRMLCRAAHWQATAITSGLACHSRVQVCTLRVTGPDWGRLGHDSMLRVSVRLARASGQPPAGPGSESESGLSPSHCPCQWHSGTLVTGGASFDIRHGNRRNQRSFMLRG